VYLHRLGEVTVALKTWNGMNVGTGHVLVSDGVETWPVLTSIPAHLPNENTTNGSSRVDRRSQTIGVTNSNQEIVSCPLDDLVTLPQHS
jgi:hypothetical protein